MVSTWKKAMWSDWPYKKSGKTDLGLRFSFLIYFFSLIRFGLRNVMFISACRSFLSPYAFLVRHFLYSRHYQCRIFSMFDSNTVARMFFSKFFLLRDALQNKRHPYLPLQILSVYPFVVKAERRCTNRADDSASKTELRTNIRFQHDFYFLVVLSNS